MEDIKFRAVLVGVDYKDIAFNIDVSMKELKSLAEALNIEVVDSVVQNMDYVHVKSYIGSGKVEELRLMIKGLDANLVIVNEELTPSQLQNLEAGLECEVIDRTYLILEIFAKRARTKEAHLQVDIARLQYMLPRLIGMNESMYSEQGGSGFRGGGETQLELDRRRIKKEIASKRHELEEAVKQRQIQRSRRKKNNVPVVALVGYTNSGKSSLLNRFLKEYAHEEKQVFVKDMLFATLETSTRHIELPNKKQFLLTDTVGFVNQLPTTLVKAFRSTLEEVNEADLLVHVIDASNPNYETQIEVTNKVLSEIGVKDIPMVYVYNKMDVCENVLIHKDDVVYMSVLNDKNIDELVEVICDKLYDDTLCRVFIPYSDMKIYSYLKDKTNILTEEAQGEGYTIEVMLSSADRNKFESFIK